MPTVNPGPRATPAPTPLGTTGVPFGTTGVSTSTTHAPTSAHHPASSAESVIALANLLFVAVVLICFI